MSEHILTVAGTTYTATLSEADGVVTETVTTDGGVIHESTWAADMVPEAERETYLVGLAASIAEIHGRGAVVLPPDPEP